MASARSTNTMMEVLQRLLQDIAVAKTLPDADLGFLVNLETTILQKIQQPLAATAGSPNGVLPQAPPQGLPGGPGGAPGMPGMGAPPMPPPGPPGGGAGIPPGLMGGLAGAGAPNADEFRRAIANAGGA